MDYLKFLESKKLIVKSSGIDVPTSDINPKLFDFQKDSVRWALAKGKSAMFLGTGLGKSACQLEWARLVHKNIGGNILVLAPLAVSQQTVREGQKFDIEVHLCRSQSDIKPGINITNYEILHKFDTNNFSGIVLDESSILKAFTGKIRTQIIQAFSNVPYRLACTATPAPNDHTELGNHAEFLGVMKREEMLAMFFVHDGGDTSQWRVKGHAKESFWKWVASWAVMMQKPSDLGYKDGGFKLPPLNIHEIVVPVDGLEAKTLTERRNARKNSLNERVAVCAEFVNDSDDRWIIWCDYNDESDKLTKIINESMEIRGSHKSDYKEDTMIAFAEGKVKRLVSKSSICGYGMNFQVCNKMAFVGLSDSFENMYQAIRRCWRFGQVNPVDVYIITASTEGAVVENIKRKEVEFQAMLSGMVAATQEICKTNIQATKRDFTEYKPEVEIIIPKWLKTAWEERN